MDKAVIRLPVETQRRAGAFNVHPSDLYFDGTGSICIVERGRGAIVCPYRVTYANLDRGEAQTMLTANGALETRCLQIGGGLPPQ